MGGSCRPGCGLHSTGDRRGNGDRLERDSRQCDHHSVVGLPARKRRQTRHRHRVRQRACESRQPERALRHRADPVALQLHHQERDTADEQPHAVDRPHGERPDHELHRPLRRPHGHGRVQRLLRLHAVGRRDAKRCHQRRPERLQLLDGRRRRRRLSADGLLAERPGNRRNHRASRSLGAVHPRRVQRRRHLVGEHGDGERQSRHRECVRRELARAGAGQRRLGLVQGPGDQRLPRPRRSLRAGERILRQRPSGEVRADDAVEHRGAGRPAR